LRVLLSAKEILLTGLGLLLLLDQVAESAAAGLEDIGDTVSLEVVLLPKLHALHGFWDPVETNTSGSEEEKARGVDRFISLEATVLLITMMDLAKGDTRAAVGDQAGIDGAAAAKETRRPVLSITTCLGVDDIARVGENVVEPVLPLLDIIVVNWTRLGWSNGLLIYWGVHFDLFEEQKCQMSD